MGKRIAESQKLMILADALLSSASDAAKRWGVSAAVIYRWTESLGGLRALRELYETRQTGAISEMALGISHEVRKRLPNMKEANIKELALEALRRRHESGGTSIQVNANAGVIAGIDYDAIAAAERAYIAALAGKSSLPASETAPLPDVYLSGDGPSGQVSTTDNQ